MICTVVQASGVEGGIVDGRCTNTGRLVSGRAWQDNVADGIMSHMANLVATSQGKSRLSPPVRLILLGKRHYPVGDIVLSLSFGVDESPQTQYLAEAEKKEKIHSTLPREAITTT